MSKKVENGLSYPGACRIVKMDLRTFSLFLHGGGK